MTASSILQSLIRCASVTPKDDGVMAVFEDILKPLGFECTRLKYDEVENLYARRGTQQPNFCFAGHVDVVPPGDLDAWSHDPFAADVENGILYGRGAVDMKGGDAAFLAALQEYLQDHDPQGSISFLITGDEEGVAVDGSVRVVEWLQERGEIIDVCLLGEPTSVDTVCDTIKNGRRGSLTGTLSVAGKQGHVAYPDIAQNPLPRMTKLLAALDDLELDQGNDNFQPSNLEITTIDVGNQISNIIPAKGTATFNVRFNDEHTAESLERLIRETLDDVGFEYMLDAHCSAHPFVTKTGAWSDLVADAVEDVCGKHPELSTSGGTSDARFIHVLCPIIECGPRNGYAHKIDEQIPLEDLETTTKIYRRILERYFSG